MVNLKRTTMFQVAALNALARGNVVERVEDADVIFTADEDGIKKALSTKILSDRILDSRGDSTKSRYLDQNSQSSTALAQESEIPKEPHIITQWDLDVFMSDLI